MAHTLDMVALLTDTEVLATSDLSVESPLFEKYPLLKAAVVTGVPREYHRILGALAND